MNSLLPPQPLDPYPEVKHKRLSIWPAALAWIVVTIFFVPTLDIGQSEAVWNIMSAVIWGIIWVYWRMNAAFPTDNQRRFFNFVLPLFWFAFHILNLCCFTPIVWMLMGY